MKRLLTLLTALLITVTLIQPAHSQEDQSDVLDITSQSFQVELQDLQVANPQLGPDHNMVYPGQPIYLDDGSVHIIQEGEYESIVLLEYLRQQQIDPNRVIAIGQPGNQAPIIISQDSETDWPWYMWLPIWAILVLISLVFRLTDIGDTLRGCGVAITNNYRHQHDNHHPQDDKPSDMDRLMAEIFLTGRMDNLLLEKGVDTPHNHGTVINVTGSGNNNISINDSSEETGETSETESET